MCCSHQPRQLDILDVVTVKMKENVGMEVDLSAFVDVDALLDKADKDGDGKTTVAELKEVRHWHTGARVCVQRVTSLQVLGADMAKMFPGKTAEEVMAMFDKDGTGSLDMAEIQAMKDSFKKGAVRQEATLGAPAEKKRGKGKVKEEPEGECQWSVGAAVVGAACVRAPA